MPNKQLSDPEPFWIDADSQARYPNRALQKMVRIYTWTARLILLLIGILFPFSLFYQLNPVLAWAWLVVGLYALARSYWNYRNRTAQGNRVDIIRANARARTGASTIGSAVHVAGHPSLGLNQEVVLALIGDRLDLFDYASPQPLDSIPIGDLVALQTVVYDDERVPHIEVIDSAAQALQLRFEREGQQVTCLFRRMQPVRPVGWYHALAKARFEAGRGH